ncbi:MAG: DUF4115 domain-containing protein [Rhodobacter sp.]|nr:DUF4115 domain-containing protein [Rhodobacter sp.]
MIGRRTEPPKDDSDGPTAGADEMRGFDDFELRLGDVMRGERATLGKSLLDVQRELKIKAPYIAAIENSDPSAFETPGFIAGYVRSYARYLGLDPEWAYRKFCEEGDYVATHGLSPQASGIRSGRADVPARKTKAVDPFVNPNTPFAPRGEAFLSRIEPGALGSSLVLVALIAAIGYGGWTVLQEVQKVQFAPVEQTPGVVADVAALAPADGLAVPETPGLQAPPAEALDRLYRPQALEVPVLTARDGPIAALDPQAVGTLLDVDAEKRETVLAGQAPEAPQPAAVPDPAPSVQVVADTSADVVLFAVRPSWVRVQGADGTVLFEKILDAGEQYALPKTEEPPLLRTGNAGSVYFAVNGQTYGPAGPGPSVVKDVSLGPDDLTANFALADAESDRDLAKFAAIVGAPEAAQ